MKLKLGESKGILKPFEETEFPDFMVLTGVNGSGKTQFLNAVSERVCSVLDTGAQRIKWVSLGGHTYDDGSSNSQFSTREYVQKVAECRLQLLEKWIDANYVERWGEGLSGGIVKARKEGIRTEYLDHFKDGVPLKEGVRESFTQNQEQMYVSLEIEFADFLGQFIGIGEHFHKWLEGRNVFSISAMDVLEEFLMHVPGDEFKGLLQNKFEAYRRKWEENEYSKYLAQAGKVRDYCSEEEFFEKYGEAPWFFFNNVLQLIGLGYQVDLENLDLIDRNKYFKLQFRERRSQSIVDFSNFSSGEKVLSSLAMAKYNIEDCYTLAPKTDIFLFDEPDSALHPSMAKQMMDILYELLHIENNSKIILTTHSPSTIACAPEDSIYEIVDGNCPVKVTKDHAISKLTAGIPTLSIDISGRRTVFVEDESDERVYQKLFGILKSSLDSSFSLTFTSLAKRKESHTDGGGCGRVKKVLKGLLGNDKFWGVIDSDNASNKEKDTCLVLGDRHSIENYIFDPIILALYKLETKGSNYRKLFKLDTDFPKNEFKNLSKEKVEGIANIIAEQCDLNSDDMIQSKYGSHKEFSISSQFKSMQGHKLAKQCIDKLKIRKENDTRSENEIALDIIDHVYINHRDFIPFEILDLFERLMRDRT